MSPSHVSTTIFVSFAVVVGCVCIFIVIRGIFPLPDYSSQSESGGAIPEPSEHNTRDLEGGSVGGADDGAHGEAGADSGGTLRGDGGGVVGDGSGGGGAAAVNS